MLRSLAYCYFALIFLSVCLVFSAEKNQIIEIDDGNTARVAALNLSA
jgi:hypothetical protein